MFGARIVEVLNANGRTFTLYQLDAQPAGYFTQDGPLNAQKYAALCGQAGLSTVTTGDATCKRQSLCVTWTLCITGCLPDGLCGYLLSVPQGARRLRSALNTTAYRCQPMPLGVPQLGSTATLTGPTRSHTVPALVTRSIPTIRSSIRIPPVGTALLSIQSVLWRRLHHRRRHRLHRRA